MTGLSSELPILGDGLQLWLLTRLPGETKPDSLLDESKIEVAVGEIKYGEDIQVAFVITNHNAQSTKNSQLHFAVRGNQNQARLKWYWRGINDNGELVEKFVEQMHLENERDRISK